MAKKKNTGSKPKKSPILDSQKEESKDETQKDAQVSSEELKKAKEDLEAANKRAEEAEEKAKEEESKRKEAEEVAEEAKDNADAAEQALKDLEEDDKKEEKKEKKKSLTKADVGEITKNAYKDKAERTKKILMAGPQVSFMCPLREGEPEGATETVSINGFALTIKKGVFVEIPQPMANILAEHYQVEMHAGKDSLINRDSVTEDALL